jgi:hypothetical protein
MAKKFAEVNIYVYICTSTNNLKERYINQIAAF